MRICSVWADGGPWGGAVGTFCEELEVDAPRRRWWHRLEPLARGWCRWVMSACSRPGGLRLLALINLVCFVVLRRLNSALELLHLPDKDGRGMADLAKGRRRATDTVDTWEFIGDRLHQAGILSHGGQTIAVSHALVDIVFSVAYVSLLALIVLALARRLDGADVADIRARALRTMLRWSFFILPLVLLAEVAENVLQIVVVFNPDSFWAGALTVAFWIKFVLLVGALVPVLPAIVVRLRREWNPVGLFFGAASLLRVQMVLIAVFAVVVLIGPTADQFQDSLRSWSTRLTWAFGGILAVLAFSITTAVSAARVVAEADQPWRKPITTSGTLLTGLGVFGVGALLTWKWDQGEGLLVAGVVLLAVGVLSVPISGLFRAPPALPNPEPAGGEADAAEQERKRALWQAMPSYLAVAPLIVLAVAMVNALIPELLGGGTRAWVLPVFAVVLFALAWMVQDRVRARVVLPDWSESRPKPRLTREFLTFAAVIASAAIVLFVAVLLDVWAVGEALGPLTFLGAFLTELTLAIGVLGILADRRTPPPAVAVLGMRRIPVVLFVLVVTVGGTLLDQDGTFHAIRLDARLTEHTLNLQEYTDGWLKARGAADGTRPAVPLVLVAAAGGGVRAAAWTALVTNCVFGAAPDDECGRSPGLGDTWRSLFAVSGASGGTVGLASVIADRMSVHRSNDRDGWVLDRLGTDLLSPSVAWQLLVEAPLVLPRLAPGMDRAEVLERTWSSRWNGQTAVCRAPNGEAFNPAELPLHSLWPKSETAAPWCDQPLPLFFPNGTSLTDGCRFNASMFDAAPDDADCGAARAWGTSEPPSFAVTRDVVDFLCTDEDVRLSTAAFLSARFPFVSPTGQVRSPDKRGREKAGACRKVAKDQVAYVGDAGYRDNTGASTLLELWQAVRPQVESFNRGQGPCVVPLFVEINNGYIDRQAPTTGGRLFESVGPLAGAVGVFSKRDAAGPELASAMFSGTVGYAGREPLTAFVSFALAPHPGVQAPLGWSLSDSSKADLLNQLSEDRNDKALKHLYKLLTPGNLRCG